MLKKLKKTISMFLILITLLGKGSFAVGQIFAQDPVPTVSEVSTPAPVDEPPPPPPTVGAAPTVNSAPTFVRPTGDPAAYANWGSPSPVPTVNSLENNSQPSPTGSDTTTGVTPTSNSEGSRLSGVTSGSSADGSGTSSSGSSINDPANILTGPGSYNSASEITAQSTELLNKNLAEVQNKVDSISTSGFNFADFNTLQSQVFTGDSLSQLNLLNKLNSNMTGIGGFAVFNVLDTYVGDIVFQMAEGNASESFNSASLNVSKNVATGPGSTNIADASSSFTVKEANGNDAHLTNDINLKSNTGGNSASFNTLGGTVKTGDAFAYGNLVNLANTNLNVSSWLFGVVNIFGTLAGNIILPQDTASTGTPESAGVLTANENTGPGSTNIATFNSESKNFLENSNNAQITSSVDAQANSGNNSASANTAGGYVQTGDSSAAVSNSTIANVNTTNEETVWMIIVNEAGKWVGKIIGSPWGATTASNSLPISQQTNGAGTVTYNANTGPLSYNEATFNTTSDTSVSNNNKAGITNNITGLSDSGNNQASYNTGPGIIETGDSKLGLNLVNMVNTNVTAKKFVAILVNVLGNFLGDIIPPGQESAPVANWQGMGTDNYSLPNNSNGNEVNNTNSATSNSPAPSFSTNSPNIGSIDEIAESAAPSSSDTNTQQDWVNYTYFYPTNDAEIQSAPTQFTTQEYNQAVGNVNQQRVNIKTTGRQFIQGIPIGVNSNPTQRVYYRGIFLSPAFAKATETSNAGILLGGISYKVDQTWLSIVPIAFIILILRRRRKLNINFSKYLNTLLEVVL